MSKWVLKAVVQKGISLLPYKHRINYLFQKYVTKGVQLSSLYFEDRLIHLKEHLHFFQKYQGGLANGKTLELGTGWYPVVPIGLFLAGAKHMFTVDISALMNKANLCLTLERYLEWEQAGTLKPYLTPLPERLEKARQLLAEADHLSFEELLSQLNLTYLVKDARQLDLADHSIQLITSNNTFEHIYPHILREILLEFKRILAEDGVMSHFIDMSDHFAHLDRKISIYHFLRFSEQNWKWIDNDVQPQNRWRLEQYRQMYQALGIAIKEEKNRPGAPEVVAKEPIADEFKVFTLEELAISHSYVIS
ncbi:MAG: class I SAM-dependent methyltransferase [Saprospiraceae bacterium]|nr:class I SAM-dependent methyltransferase [Saprospiraceae bacterium]